MRRNVKILLTIGAAAGLIGAGLAPVSEGGRKFVKSLTGQAELDGGRVSADRDGRGIAHVTVNVGQNRVCWDLRDLANLDPLVASHIHEGPANGQGPIKISFFNFGEPIDLEGCTEAPGTTAFPFDRDRLRDVLEHPENYYVNIHTSAFPGGAIRGQLRRGDQDAG